MTATIWQGRSRPVEIDAEFLLPIDRTICPACLGQPENAGCKHCGDRSVCPSCRGARQISMKGPRLLYRTCHTCTSATGEFDDQLQWEHGVSVPDRKLRAIDAEQERYRRYRATQDVPQPVDPWDAYTPKEVS